MATLKRGSGGRILGWNRRQQRWIYGWYERKKEERESDFFFKWQNGKT